MVCSMCDPNGNPCDGCKIGFDEPDYSKIEFKHDNLNEDYFEED